MLPYSEKLRDLVERTSPHAVPKLEVLAVEASDIKQSQGDWPTGANHEILRDGVVVLNGSNSVSTDQLDNTGAYVFGPNRIPEDIPPGANSAELYVFGFNNDLADDVRIRRVEVIVNKRAQGTTDFAGNFRLQLFGLAPMQPRGTRLIDRQTIYRPVELVNLEPIDATTLGAGDVTIGWDIVGGSNAILTLGQLGRTDPDANLFPGQRVLVIHISMTDDDANAANAGWRTDTANDTEVGADGSGRGHKFFRLDRGDFAGHFDDLTLTGQRNQAVKLYSVTYPASAQFTVGIDLGAAPTQTVEFQARWAARAGSSVVTEVENDAATAFVAFKDGQTTADLAGVSDKQTYTLRVTLNANAGLSVSPLLYSVGATSRAIRDVSDYIESMDTMIRVNPFNGKSEITQLPVRLVREGVRDFLDQVSELATQFKFSDLQFRVMLGSDLLPREDWLHIDTFDVDDRQPESGTEVFNCLSILQRLRVSIPRPTDLGGGSFITIPVVYDSTSTAPTNEINEVYRDIILNLAAVPKRYTGDAAAASGFIGFPSDADGGNDTVSNILTKTIAKDEIDRLSNIMGGATISEQGRLRFVDLYGEKAVVARFWIEEIQSIDNPTGLRARVPEIFVEHSWDIVEKRFRGKVRGFNTAAFTELGPSRIDRVPQLDTKTARWIDHAGTADAGKEFDTGAARVARNLVERFGSGHMEWEVKLSVPHPHISIGDLVAVETASFTARHPVTGDPLHGLLVARAVVVGRNLWGTRFVVWVRSYNDISSARDPSDIGDTPILPEILSTTVTEEAGFSGRRVKRCVVVDGDTMEVRVYRRKGTGSCPGTAEWPTKDGTQTGQIDPKYSRGVRNAKTGWCVSGEGFVANDVVRDIFVPVGFQNQEGERKEYCYVVTGSATPVFVTTSREEVQSGTSCTTGSRRQVKLNWTLDGATDADQDVNIYRRIDGKPEKLITTITNPVTVTTFTDEVPMFADANASLRTVDYRLSLVTGATENDTELLGENDIYFGVDCDL